MIEKIIRFHFPQGLCLSSRGLCSDGAGKERQHTPRGYLVSLCHAQEVLRLSIIVCDDFLSALAPSARLS